MLKLVTMCFLAVAFVLTLLSGCYNPSASGIYTCEEKNPYCPNGLKCIDGWCGGRTGVQEDAAIPDGAHATQDLTIVSVQPDMWGIQGVTDGCRSGHGFVISATSVACPGIFPSDPSMVVCGDGWSTCPQNPLTASVCKGRNPFGIQACFIGTVRAADRNIPTDIQSVVGTWAGADANQYRYILGCGACPGWSDAAIQFGGFTNTVECDQPLSEFRCPKTVPGKDSDFLKVSNNGPDNGVFCCKG